MDSTKPASQASKPLPLSHARHTHTHTHYRYTKAQSYLYHYRYTKAQTLRRSHQFCAHTRTSTGASAFTAQPLRHTAWLLSSRTHARKQGGYSQPVWPSRVRPAYGEGQGISCPAWVPPGLTAPSYTLKRNPNPFYPHNPKWLIGGLGSLKCV